VAEQFQKRPAPTQTAPPTTAAKSATRTQSTVRTDPIALTHTEAVTTAAAKKSQGLQMEEPIVTAGTSGELNIKLEKFWVEVEGHLPCGFDVATLASNGLEVTMEQLSYRKVHTGVGALKTGLAPIAPIGTKGRVIVRDTATGETVEQPWTWKVWKSSGGGLWQFLKQLLWKG
jgi:hypothetical protein